MSAGQLPGRRDPAQPLVTLLDGSARVELSGATAANWAAKTANLLQAYGRPGRVGLLLPLHWQAVTLLLGTVWAGSTAVVAGEVAELATCEVAFVTADDAEAALLACPGEVLAVSGAPLGGRLAGLPPLVLDAGAELPSYADQLEVPAPSGWAVEHAGRPVGPLPDLGLLTADRVLTCLPPASAAGLLVGLLAPLAAGSALVLAPGLLAPGLLAPGLLAPGALAAEGVTASVGCDVPGARRLA